MKSFWLKALVVGIVGAVAVLVLRWRFAPAQVHSLVLLPRLTGSGFDVEWQYGRGVVPQAMIMDVVVGEFVGGVSVFGPARHAGLPMTVTEPTAYTVTVTAAYRILGLLWHETSTFQGVLTPVAAA